MIFPSHPDSLSVHLNLHGFFFYQTLVELCFSTADLVFFAVFLSTINQEYWAAVQYRVGAIMEVGKLAAASIIPAGKLAAGG